MSQMELIESLKGRSVRVAHRTDLKVGAKVAMLRRYWRQVVGTGWDAAVQPAANAAAAAIQELIKRNA